MKIFQPLLIALLVLVLSFKLYQIEKMKSWSKERSVEMYKLGAFHASCTFYDCALTPRQIDSLYQVQVQKETFH